MSKKTATKKTKKPTQKVATLKAKRTGRVWHTGSDDPAADFRKFATSLLIDIKDRLTALESRSAPAEGWKPKVGDWVVVTNGSQYGSFPEGSIFDICEVDKEGDPWSAPTGQFSAGVCFDEKWLRPATPAEIADHKAKEEQRAKEAEWAKFDVLQRDDAVYSSESERIELARLAKEGGVPVCSVFPPGSNGVDFSRWDGRTIIRAYGEAVSNNWLPFPEFKRRLQGTIAKRAEDERAKEMAKPVAFGALVRINECPHIEARFLWWDTNEKKIARIAYYSEQSCGTKEYTRDQFQIID